MGRKLLIELGNQMTLLLSSSSAKAAIAIAALFFLSGTLLLQAAHAQQSGGSNNNNNNKFKVNLSETLAAGDAASKGPSLKNGAVSDRMAVSDAISKSVEKPLHRAVATKVSIKDSIRKSVTYATHKASRSVFEQVSIWDSARGPSAVAVGESLAVSERPLLSGAVVPPSPPQLTMVGEQQQKTFHSDRDDSVAIVFNSSSTGTYRVDIDDAAGDTVATITGAMAAGENQAMWTGVDLHGKAVPSGTYTYYVTAKNGKGVRAAPGGGGDGTIVVAGDEDGDNATAGAPSFPGIRGLKMPPVELLLPAIAATIVGAAALLFIILKRTRRKDLVLYLPSDAAPVIDDIRQKYPLATAEDYVSTGEQGASKRYIGVAIADSKESDDEWILGIIARAKELAGVDSISLTYRGKAKSV